MNAAELSALLQSMGAPVIAYSVGADDDECYCLLVEDGRWHVYYSERGNRNNERIFADESAACHELLDRLRRDGIIKQGPEPNS